jgi:uncharacterized protein (TIGR03663 family)
LEKQVSTASTKSNKQRKSVANSRSKTTAVAGAEPLGPDVSRRSWLIASISIFLIGAFLRLYNLPLVPFHHDEGVNGNFLVRLVREGIYRYDPENYHGPTLYYFAAIIPWVTRFFFGPAARDAHGLTDFTVRLVPVLFGLGTIWLVLSLRRRLGTIGTLAAAAFVAVSPGAVYLSRYFIHESLFVFFTLGIVVAALKYYEDGHPVYLILAAASAALLFATKETWIISVAVLLIALLTTHAYRWLWRTLIGDQGGDISSGDSSAGSSEGPGGTIVRLGGLGNIAVWTIAAVAIFVIIGVLFYSSFRTNWKGVSDSLKTFEVWTKTSKNAHVHSTATYLAKWLPFQEAPLLVLGLLGAGIITWKPRNSFALFSALWAFGIIAAYSLVPYKTPWLMLNFIVPLALVSGYAIEYAYQLVKNNEVSKTVGLVVAVVVWCVASGALPNLALTHFDKPTNWKTMIPGYQMVDLNFVNYDNDDEYYVYIYAHTRRGLLTLVDDIDLIAQRNHTGAETGITIVSPDYWPLPWYFRDYIRVGYYGRMSPSTEPVIIASANQQAEVEGMFGDRYRRVGSTFALRPGVELLIFVRNDVPAP